MSKTHNASNTWKCKMVNSKIIEFQKVQNTHETNTTKLLAKDINSQKRLSNS